MEDNKISIKSEQEMYSDNNVEQKSKLVMHSKVIMSIGAIIIVVVLTWLTVRLLIQQKQNSNINEPVVTEIESKKSESEFVPEIKIKNGDRIQLYSQEEIRKFLEHAQYDIGETSSFLKKIQNTDRFFTDNSQLPEMVYSRIYVSEMNSVATAQNDLFRLADKRGFAQTRFHDWDGRVDQKNNIVYLNAGGNQLDLKIKSGIPHSFVSLGGYVYVFGSSENFYSSDQYKNFLRKSEYSFVEVFNVTNERESNDLESFKAYHFEGNVSQAFISKNRLHVHLKINDYRYFAAEPLLPRWIQGAQELKSPEKTIVNSYDINYRNINVHTHFSFVADDIANPGFKVQHDFVNGDELVHIQHDSVAYVFNTEFDVSDIRTKSMFDLLYDQLPYDAQDRVQMIAHAPNYILLDSERRKKFKKIFDDYLYTLNLFERSKFLEIINQDVVKYFEKNKAELEKSVYHTYSIFGESFSDYNSYSIDGYVFYEESFGDIYYKIFEYVPIIFSRQGVVHQLLKNEFDISLPKELQREQKNLSYLIHDNTLKKNQWEFDKQGLKYFYIDQWVFQLSHENKKTYLYGYRLDSQSKEFGPVGAQHEIANYNVMMIGPPFSHAYGFKKNMIIDDNGVVSQNGLVIDKFSWTYDRDLKERIQLFSDSVQFNWSNLGRGYFADEEREILYMPIFNNQLENANQIAVIDLKNMKHIKNLTYDNNSKIVDYHNFEHSSLTGPTELINVTDNHYILIDLETQEVKYSERFDEQKPVHSGRL